MTMKPIFFAWTKSFWLGLLAVVALVASDSTLIDGLSQLVALSLSIDLDVVDGVMGRLVPALATIAALQQRSGSARPYTMRMSKETLQ